MLKLALTGKWLGALLLCLLLAVGFALLAQWQVGRTVLENNSHEIWTKENIVKLDSIAQPNAPFTFNEVTQEGNDVVLTKVTAELTLNPSGAVLVANRIQLNGDRGYWVVIPAATSKAELFVAVGFVQGDDQARKALNEIQQLDTVQAFMPLTGRYLPSDAPVQSISKDVYSSLSVAQLINRESSNRPSYAGFLALTESNQFSQIQGMQQLPIGLAQTDSPVNWLSAFYAIEWSVFAGFAVFMWWRLLADAFKKQQEALLAE